MNSKLLSQSVLPVSQNFKAPWAIALGLVLSTLTGCAGNTSLQDAFKPDPRLLPTSSPSPSSLPSPEPIAVSPKPTPASSPSASPSISPSASSSPSPSAIAAVSSTWTDLDKTQPALRPYIQDLTQLNLIRPTTEKTRLSDPISRRTFAQWLFAVNNRYQSTHPNKQIRSAAIDSQPVFQDLLKSDADFVVVQGLAEAGIIPSALSGAAGADRFYPDRPLTREDLLRWKVPLDARAALPVATMADIKKTWAFQDADKINPAALPALYHDHQNGDASNLRRALGYSTLLQPQKSVTYAEAAAVLWSIGFQSDRITAQDVQNSTP